jgi:putative DNA primase/helicase
MNPEQTRHEQFNQDPTQLRDRFRFGVLKELQNLPQWVVWKREVGKEGNQKKAPHNPNHRNAYASVKIPQSWGTLNQALTALESGEYSGIGFMITPPLVLIDIDHSYDRATQTITNPLAEEIMNAVPTYYEASPYTGVHGLVYVDTPIKNLHTDTVEIYGHDRFTTITTDHIAGTPTTIENRTEEVAALYRRFAPPPVEEREYQNTGGGCRERQRACRIARGSG